MKHTKKFLALLALTSIIACGPSAEEKAAAEQAKLDSIAAAEALEAEKAAEEMMQQENMKDSTTTAGSDSVSTEQSQTK
jgi:hypothetical protein